MKQQLFYEDVIERCGDTVIISNVRPATKKEIDIATRLHNNGKCPHTIIKDTTGYLYDFRDCAICGKGLGVV